MRVRVYQMNGICDIHGTDWFTRKFDVTRVADCYNRLNVSRTIA